jgi:hypothetical protein
VFNKALNLDHDSLLHFIGNDDALKDFHNNLFSDSALKLKNGQQPGNIFAQVVRSFDVSIFGTSRVEAGGAPSRLLLG